MWYLCGLGSNIDPEDNFPKAITLLLNQFEMLWLSPVHSTEPKGIDSSRQFLNALVVFRSQVAQRNLKARLDCLEELLGRDKKDPLSSKKDRTIDVDILEISVSGFFEGKNIKESYFQALFNNDNRDVTTVSLSLEGNTLGQTPTTIYRDLSSGNKIIVQQSKNLKGNAMEPAFAT